MSEAKVDFLNVLAELKNGRAQIDCSRKLTELTEAVCDTKKPGKLILELKLEPTGVGDDGNVKEVSITWAARIAKPERETGRSIFFMTKDHRLTRNDPDQAELFEPDAVKQEEAPQSNARD